MKSLTKPTNMAFWIVIIGAVLVVGLSVWLVFRIRNAIDSRVEKSLTEVGQNVAVAQIAAPEEGNEPSDAEYQEIGRSAIGESVLAISIFDYFNRNAAPPPNLAVLVQTSGGRNASGSEAAAVLNDPWNHPYSLKWGDGGRIFT